MKWIAPLLTVFLLFISACETTAPTPFLMGSLVDQKNEVVALYNACSEGAGYVVTKEGCDPILLEEKVKSTMDFAKVFIGGDPKQPQGYDVYLATVMVLFRISQVNTNEFSDAERIARQFFEIQKASSGRSLAMARFYWAEMTAGHASWQWYYDRHSLYTLGITDPEISRKIELLQCLAEVQIGLTDSQGLDGFRKIKLNNNIGVITWIVNKIE